MIRTLKIWWLGVQWSQAKLVRDELSVQWQACWEASRYEDAKKIAVLLHNARNKAARLHLEKLKLEQGK